MKKEIIKVSAIFQILLMTSMTFALSILMSTSFVSGFTEEEITAKQIEEYNIIDKSSPPSVTAASPARSPGWDGAHPIKSTLGGKAFGGGVAGSLTAGVAWGAIAFLAVKTIGGLLGLDEGVQSALEKAAFAGSFAAGTLKSLATNGVGSFGSGNGVFGTLGAHPFVTGLGIAVVVFVLTYSKETRKVVNFQCMPFEPKIGGVSCEACNGDIFRPCTEYRCKSLGQACELLNPNTAQAMCAWKSRNDVKSPVISPWVEALYPVNLKYQPDTAVRPPAIGTKILSNSGGCLPAFTPLEFGIYTDEPAQCKVDYNHTAKFDDMQYYFGDTNYYAYNHTQKMRLPGPVNSANDSAAPQLFNDGNFALYTRCRDSNGNENVDEYVFSFCVDKGPDTTPPVIEEFSINSGNFVGFGQDKVPIEVYVNEPAECKWSIESKAYEDMENTMKCFTEGYQVNGNLQYVCSGNITGVKNMQENKYYFRCKDQPGVADNLRNTNMQSKEFILRGSQGLNIIKLLPNETITGSTDSVKVDLEIETDDGAQEGKSVCYFSSNGAKDSYIKMFETDNFLHNQTLTLAAGNYTYFFRCIDAGGNAAENKTTFDIEIDKQAPRITRAYKQEALKIVTDEDAECSYSLTTCNFNINEGIDLIYSHPDIRYNLFAEWKSSNVYHIKCIDKYGNEPSPNVCSMVISAVELAKQK